MEKRVILAFVLSFVVLYAFRALYMPKPTSEPTATATAPESVAPTPPSNPPKQVPSSPAVEAAPEAAENIGSEKREDVVFETPLYIATFSNVGGVLKSFKLKGYPDGEGQPVQLINQQAGEKVGWPLAVLSGEKEI